MSETIKVKVHNMYGRGRNGFTPVANVHVDGGFDGGSEFVSLTAFSKRPRTRAHVYPDRLGTRAPIYLDMDRQTALNLANAILRAIGNTSDLIAYDGADEVQFTLRLPTSPGHPQSSDFNVIFPSVVFHEIIELCGNGRKIDAIKRARTYYPHTFNLYQLKLIVEHIQEKFCTHKS